MTIDPRPCETRADISTQPAWLAAIARFFNVDAPEISQARVLEIGCGTGAHIIPLALRFPAARFTGIDIAAAGIAAGKARAADLGLQNVDLRVQNIIEFAEGEFDYILAKGVFSRVSGDVQDAVLRIVRDHLAPDGLFTMNYNVLPGAYLRAPVRDLMSYRTAEIDDPTEKIRAAKDIVRQVSAFSGTVYGGTFSREYEMLRGAADCAIEAEFLDRENDAWYFRDVVARAKAYGLEFLSETYPWYAFSDVYAPEMVRDVGELIGADSLAFEQYIDYYMARRMRTSIFGKTAAVAQRDLQVTRENIGRLYFSPAWPIIALPNFRDVENSQTIVLSAGFPEFSCHTTIFSARSQLSERIFRYLGERCNGTGRMTSVAEIAAALTAPDAPGTEHYNEAAEVLFDLLRGGLLYISSVDPGAGPVSDRPRIFALAAADARNGAASTANLLNDAIGLDDAETRRFMQLCDGRRTIEQLVLEVVTLFRAGEISLLRADSALAMHDAAPEPEARAWVNRALELLAANRLLLAE